MRYIIRALKYFVQITVIMTLILAALMLAGVVSRDIDIAFRSGWKSVGYILAMFAAVAAVYPYFGYARRSVAIRGEYPEIREGILAALKGRGYMLEKEDRENLVFRLASPLARVARLWEDRLTFTRELGGYSIEGLNKDLVRVAGALQYRFRQEADPEKQD